MKDYIQQGYSLLISCTLAICLSVIECQDKILVEEVLPIDKVSVLPFSLLNRAERLSANPEKGIVYPTCSSKWDSTVSLKTEPAFRFRTPARNDTFTFLDYFDIRTDREYFAVTYYYDQTAQKFTKYQRQGEHFEQLDYNAGVGYSVSLESCGVIYVLPYYEFQSNGMLEGVYCLEGNNLIYLTTTKTKTSEWRRSRISEQDEYPDDLHLLSRFGREVFNYSYTVAWMH